MTYRFIDLFAGIGGIHLAFDAAGAKCVFASEMEKHARATYEKNFSHHQHLQQHQFAGDITKVDPSHIPPFDILAGGFPCQAFSNAGKRRGFDDARGTLFFNIAHILKHHQPHAFFLENVRGLLAHDNGKTFQTIQNILTQDLGYSFYWKVIKACDFGLPQLRPRVYMIGFKDPTVTFEFPAPTGLSFTMSDVFGGKCTREIGFTLRVGGRGSSITDRRNWDCYMVDGAPRMLTVAQAQRMQGFPAHFTFAGSTTQSFKQLGNSVAVSAVQACAVQMIQALLQHQKVPAPAVAPLFNHTQEHLNRLKKASLSPT